MACGYKPNQLGALESLKPRLMINCRIFAPPPAMEATHLFTGTFVQVSKPGSGLEIYPSHLLAINGAGVITDFVDSSSDRAKHLLSSVPYASQAHINHTSFFLPTFSDLHLHAPQTLYLGTGLHLPLMQFKTML